jgi:hypothetical protein
MLSGVSGISGLKRTMVSTSEADAFAAPRVKATASERRNSLLIRDLRKFE